MPPPFPHQILPVSEFTRRLKQFYDTTWQFVRISGEISNLKTAFSGHSYFSLKEGGAQLQAVLFKQKKRFVDVELQDGQDVICFGRVTVYEPRGSYQMVVDSVELNGTGELQRQFELLKKKLAARGCFDDAHKRPIPAAPARIAVVSSPEAAAFTDFVQTLKLRGSTARIQLLPVPVQGKEAGRKIAAAIDMLAETACHDVIVLLRGGGSLEDLQAFNEECVANSIFKATLPVVTGIGHEVDFTIADLCADRRCSTPTAAAEQLSPDRKETVARLLSCRRRLVQRMRLLVEKAEGRLKLQRSSLQQFAAVLASLEYRRRTGSALLEQAYMAVVLSKKQQLTELRQRLLLTAPNHQIRGKKQAIQTLSARLAAAMERQYTQKEMQLAAVAALLNGVSPLATLARGYAIARKRGSGSAPGAVLRNQNDVTRGEQIEVLLNTGGLVCEVIARMKKERSAGKVR